MKILSFGFVFRGPSPTEERDMFERLRDFVCEYDPGGRRTWTPHFISSITRYLRRRGEEGVVDVLPTLKQAISLGKIRRQYDSEDCTCRWGAMYLPGNRPLYFVVAYYNRPRRDVAGDVAGDIAGDIAGVWAVSPDGACRDVSDSRFVDLETGYSL